MEEIKETVFIAVGCILIASVLWFASAGLRLRDKFADIRNTEVQTAVNAKAYREFNKYDGGAHAIGGCDLDISGWEAVAVIREYLSDDTMEVYVDRDVAGNELLATSALARENPEDYAISYLQTILDSSSEYHPMLIYDGANPKDINYPQERNYASTVTAIKLIRIK